MFSNSAYSEVPFDSEVDFIKLGEPVVLLLKTVVINELTFILPVLNILVEKGVITTEIDING